MYEKFCFYAINYKIPMEILGNLHQVGSVIIIGYDLNLQYTVNNHTICNLSNLVLCLQVTNSVDMCFQNMI